MRELILTYLRGGMPALTPASGERLAEAASHCLDEQGHELRVVLAVAGNHTESFVLERLPVDEVIRRTYNDPEEATEEGACAIAILLARELTGWSVVRRARRGTGFDYYLGSDQALDFQARLEVSGIRQGTQAQIEARVRQKRAQTTQSDSTLGHLSAYVIVVEFSRPEARIERR
ncbi:MAG: hypothetical protein NTX57_08550 [Armatimonadetes bacterium]|nr:hypothetical protein [Armatimonadota bacterium]